MEAVIPPTNQTREMTRNFGGTPSRTEPISSWPWGTGSPAKIACITDNGIREAMIANASPRLTKNPTLNRVADMPAATPRRTTGTEFMIEATLGAMNKPPPIPARIIGKTRMVYGTWYGRAANQMYEAADTSSPPVVKNRGPYRSERYPLRGPMLTNARENGIKRRPAVRASSPSAPWK